MIVQILQGDDDYLTNDLSSHAGLHAGVHGGFVVLFNDFAEVGGLSTNSGRSDQPLSLALELFDADR